MDIACIAGEEKLVSEGNRCSGCHLNELLLVRKFIVDVFVAEVVDAFSK